MDGGGGSGPGLGPHTPTTTISPINIINTNNTEDTQPFAPVDCHICHLRFFMCVLPNHASWWFCRLCFFSCVLQNHAAWWFCHLRFFSMTPSQARNVVSLFLHVLITCSQLTMRAHRKLRKMLCCVMILPPSLFFVCSAKQPIWHLRKERCFAFFSCPKKPCVWRFVLMNFVDGELCVWGIESACFNEYNILFTDKERYITLFFSSNQSLLNFKDVRL